VIFIPPHMIIKSIQQLFSMFIVRIRKRTTRTLATHNGLKPSKSIIKRFTRFLRESLVLSIVNVLIRWLNFTRTLISVAQFKPNIMTSF
jgi:hypothetical protein